MPKAILPQLVATALLTFGGGGAAVAADAPVTWVLGGAQVWASPDSAPIDDGVVLIQGGKVVAVGARGRVDLPADARPSPCSGGALVVAGFQNNHFHFLDAAVQGADKRPPAELDAYLRLALTRYGFTTVVDTASDRANTLALRARIAAGQVAGPRILTVGLPIYPPNGLPFYVAGLPQPMRDARLQPDAPAQAVAIVQENLDAGADGTKLFVATPQLDRTIKRMPDAVASAAADATHARSGKLVMAHPTDMAGIEAALAAQVDVLVHTTLDAGRSWPDDLVRRMIAQRMAVVPTLKLWRYELNKERVPAAITDRFEAAAMAQLKAFSDAGGAVLFGTDAGYMTDLDPSDEYALMAQAGLTTAQILASLTTAPAARWNESARRGRIAAGLAADLVVLDADPRVDARNFTQVRCSLRDGVTIYQKAK